MRLHDALYTEVRTSLPTRFLDLVGLGLKVKQPGKEEYIRNTFTVQLGNGKVQSRGWTEAAIENQTDGVHLIACDLVAVYLSAFGLPIVQQNACSVALSLPRAHKTHC